jgi:hypothetical protein
MRAAGVDWGSSNPARRGGFCIDGEAMTDLNEAALQKEREP